MVTQPGNRPSAVIVAASVIFIASMTLWPVEAATMSLTSLCVFCGNLGGVDFALNTVLFVPLGLGLRWLLGNWKTPVLIGATITLVVETLQWRIVPGRDASLGDLLANTLGTLIGVWLAIESLRWLNATHVAARRLAGNFGLLAAVVVMGSAWLLRPALTREGQYLQWTPTRPHTDLFQGRVSAVDLNGIPVGSFEILLPKRLLDTNGTQSVRAVINGPVPVPRRKAIIVVSANRFEEGFTIAQWREALVFRSRVAGARLKLHSPGVELENGLAPAIHGDGDQGSSMTIEARSTPRAISIRRETADSENAVTLRRTVGLAWALLLPWDIAIGPAWWPVNAAWLATIMIPVSFFTIRSGRKAPADSKGSGVTWWPFALTLVAFAAAPVVTGLSALGPGEWLGLLLGVGTGAAIERFSAPREPVVS